ncbi:DEAD/DEAH box helicase [Romboutsia lituseburensis]|uniref:Superfamily II DNA or RNA helicase, SNF2 family n=1 Tax=Romboutsia lituseburensis DSM 797 TaxID=1121325 RepID=A0A1G9J4F8_9FIRM|nr:SNF2 helicase associated domain-containing protein [Romboutsia lituseburensis]CEH33639.1 TATA-binding protein-associated factor MOT1 [Romboutsia lituseburensis]SDL32221.1 Superfamily II DNA or RNA helicase, SNF2 family [Romboutsia lituseburensis DSM 797]
MKTGETMNFINKDFLNYFKSKPKQEVKLDVSLELIGEDSIKCDFYIGIDNMYKLKNLRDFSKARLNAQDIIYGPDFMYNISNNYFGYDEEKIVEMIEEYGIGLSYTSSLREQQSMYLNGGSVKRLIEYLEYKDFEFKYRNLYYTPRIIRGDLPISISLEMDDNKVLLKSEGKLPVPISQRGDVVFYKGDIYLLSGENGIYYKKLYTILEKYNEISFKSEEVSEVLTNVVPKLEKITNNVIIDENIEENISEKLLVKYYFDLEEEKITCDIKFDYEGENEGKFIVKNEQKEEEAIYRLYTYYFEKDNNKYIFTGNDEQLYDFLTVEINRLKNIGEVYYSDKLKAKKIYSSSSIRIGLGEEINHYLEFSFKIDGINEKEYKNIIKAFKDNKRFYKLGNGNFINLEEQETKDTFKLMESLGFTSDFNRMQINTNKALYIENLMTDKKLPYIEGIEKISEISRKIKSIDEEKIEIPKHLNATLRDYQIDGLNWFKTLEKCGFGGILADEMGLGKTLQTITFLLSENDKKSLIITPTSLVYNWKKEFEKFAPSLKIAVAHGSKKEREKIVSNIDSYDVILTTYGSLRNDLEKYEEINFDYCIIDEAQNIKNPTAISTDAVKSINAHSKFALTGTPIENNLLELWSIFDFIMPGYLYSLRKFDAIFIKDESQLENLKKMIKPFILRRTKKQVIKELPDKIEKEFLVELNREQKKAYAIYADYTKKKLEEQNNKITVFSYLTKLRQLCLDPSIVIDDYSGKSSKIEACLEIIKDYTQIESKVLVFSQFTTVLKNIGAKLDKNNIKYVYLDGQTKAEERLRLVDEFNKSKEINVFLISLKAGGTGLNLTSANTVIHFDPWWNPAVENQASDRAHRYGQREVVEVIKLIAKGTIEEKIVKLQENKKELIDDIINNDLSQGNILKGLSEKDILDLFK